MTGSAPHKVVLPDTESRNGALILVFAMAVLLALALHELGVLLRHYLRNVTQARAHVTQTS